MPLKTVPLRSVIVSALAALGLTLAVNFGYGLACLAWGGASPMEAMRAMQSGSPWFVLGLFLAAVGLILGSSLAVHSTGRRARWIGLAAGAGLALAVLAVGWARGRLDFWLPPNALMAAIGGWLGDHI
jgi:hypothetical protein